MISNLAGHRGKIEWSNPTGSGAAGEVTASSSAMAACLVTSPAAPPDADGRSALKYQLPCPCDRRRGQRAPSSLPDCLSRHPPVHTPMPTTSASGGCSGRHEGAAAVGVVILIPGRERRRRG
jgi:hypothetical protein